jgi:hypothetical protein
MELESAGCRVNCLDLGFRYVAAASHASSTPTISPISQSRFVTPAAIAVPQSQIAASQTTGVTPGGHWATRARQAEREWRAAYGRY